jgi:hypothetical protein
VTSPMPPIPEDPSFIEGQRLQAEYTAQSQAIRGDFGITDVAKAQQIVALWEATNARLSALYVDLQNRRQARIDVLEKIVPLGPGIAAGTSPADAAVLHQAFRSALAEASASDFAGRRTMLADAERFDDDCLRRATLTAAVDVSDVNLIKSWVQMRGDGALLDELVQLREAIAGRSLWNFKLAQTLGALAKPQEAFALAGLVAARDVAIREANRTRNYYPS